MRYSRLLLICAMFISFQVSADTTPEDCQKQGDVAESAADLRMSGVDKETATGTLTEMYGGAGSGVTAQTIEGMVTVAFMAKMKPDQMRDYVVAECQKDILK